MQEPLGMVKFLTMIMIISVIILIVIKAIITIVVLIILLLSATRYVTGLLHERELAMRREQQGLHPWSAAIKIAIQVAINFHQKCLECFKVL